MIKTKYVWTALGEHTAVEAGLNETRAEGFPANFAYQPLELSGPTERAWLGAGYIKEVTIPLPFLQFYWEGENTTASMHMIKMFNENNIKWCYGAFGELKAAIGEHNKMVQVEYYHVKGNLYGILEKPKSTSSYFKLTPEELYVENSDGYTKEEALLCDHNVHAQPFAVDLWHAIRKAADYLEIGCDEVEILQRINNKYAVVCH